MSLTQCTVADPGFPVGGVDLMGGRGPRGGYGYENFVCQNERIWTRRGACAGHAPLNPPMEYNKAMNSRRLCNFKSMMI